MELVLEQRKDDKTKASEASTAFEQDCIAYVRKHYEILDTALAQVAEREPAEHK